MSVSGAVSVKIKRVLTVMLGSAILPPYWLGKPWFVHITPVFGHHEVHLNRCAFLQGVIFRGEESCQAQCFSVQYILVWFRLFKERWKIPDMNLFPELLAQSFLLAGDRERRG